MRVSALAAIVHVVVCMVTSGGAVQFPHEAFVCPETPVLTTQCLSRDMYREITAAIGDLIDNLPQNCKGTSCPVADFVGCVVRLAGHDFMDFNGTTGGADGCLDFADPDNKGLLPCMNSSSFDASVDEASLQNTSLQSVYAQFCTVVSVADFVVISAEAVMSKQSRRGHLNFEGQFAYGRTTNENCSGNPSMPNPEGSCGEVDRVFLQNMGLSWREAAVLMGVHTLGRAHPENSGYDGWWSNAANSASFNNNYYTALISRGWKPEKNVHGNPGKNQWIRTDTGNWRNGVNPQGHKEMMLNTDLCLVYKEEGESINAATHQCCTWLSSSDPDDLVFGLPNCGSERACCGSRRQFNTDGSPVDCGNRHQPKGPAAEAVRDFHGSERTWLREFLPVWKKVTENGFSNLKPLELDGNCTPGLEPTVSPSTSPSILQNETRIPTENPSSSPSTSPTLRPTTLEPTHSPSLKPSSSPSDSPTTLQPTPLPSANEASAGCVDGYVRLRNGKVVTCRVLKAFCKSHYVVAKTCCYTCSGGY